MCKFINNENTLQYTDHFYSETNLARLRESIANLNAVMGEVHELIEVEDEYGMD